MFLLDSLYKSSALQLFLYYVQHVHYVIYALVLLISAWYFVHTDCASSVHGQLLQPVFCGFLYIILHRVGVGKCTGAFIIFALLL